MKWVMVLADGDTYSQLDGASIVAIPDHMPDEEIEEFVKHADGWYCFEDNPPDELESNNGFTDDQLVKQDLDYYRENWKRIESITTPWGRSKGL